MIERMTHGFRDTLRSLALQHLSPEVAEKWLGLHDAGALYWLIRPEGLAERRFERAMFTWQCSW
ncbi:DUF1963 domain-containing protein [Streptomyces sp. NPDC085463]|uniref:DUF1963 domain-containing protein n=1 Tax=Streptomyces sp. NPDC085463 TaxID=3365724 RepID=UPI0037CD11E0